MTRIILVIVFAFTIMQSFAQIDTQQSNVQLTQNTHTIAYRLFPTENMWIFIKLNTRNGKMWQVEFDLKKSKSLESTFSSETLVTIDKEVNDRFTLYPTQNLYTFILLDQLDGRVWQVEWSIKEKNRNIFQIN